MFKKGLWEEEKNAKVCAIDLDGVLVDYPKCWIDFINAETKNKFKSLYEAKEILIYNDYKRIKKKYRTCEVKATLPIKTNALEFITALKKDDFKIILLTSRPYRQYREIWKDTTIWLRNNGIDIDGIIWDEEKHWAVLREFPYIRFMVEDNAEIANQVARVGYKVYVVDNEYNHQPLEKNCSRVFDLLDIIKSEVLE